LEWANEPHDELKEIWVSLRETGEFKWIDPLDQETYNELDHRGTIPKSYLNEFSTDDKKTPGIITTPGVLF